MQNETINGSTHVELAKYCARTCHALNGVTQGRDVESLSSHIKRAIEDLGRYVNLVHSLLPAITGDARTMRNIESAVSEHRNGPHGLREQCPGPTKECLIAWRTELWETLRILGVRDCRFSVYKF